MLIASSGRTDRSLQRGSVVGQRLPFIPPTGSVFAAGSDDAEIGRWLRVAGADADLDSCRQALTTVRHRGYSLALLSVSQRAFAATLNELAADAARADGMNLVSIVQNFVYDPAELTQEARRSVRQISVPVFDEDGHVALAISAFDFRRPEVGIERYIDRVVRAGTVSTTQIGGTSPDKWLPGAQPARPGL